MPEPAAVRSPAWILSGLFNDPGQLTLVDGRLSFVSEYGGVVFDEPLDRVTDVRFPWYQFSGGFTARIGGRRRRISLTRPNDALAGESGPFGPAVGDLFPAACSLEDVDEGRRTGRRWRELLAGAIPEQRSA